MTLKEAYEAGEEILLTAGITDARLDAWFLLEYITGISRAVYFAFPEKELDKSQWKQYNEAIARRAQHIPLQHITGEQEFMGLEFYVNEHVLVPRQDTEVLVEEALLRLENRQEENIRILDMCTGSGCILLSILWWCKNDSGKKYGNVTGTGVDISTEALAVAHRNNEELALDAAFISSDLFERVSGKYHMILSNPPYIRTSEIEKLEDEVKGHDPYLALDGKEDGLYFYRAIIKEAKEYLYSGGILGFEIGYDQGEAVSNLLTEHGYTAVIVKKDLAGLDRVVIAVYDDKSN